MIYVNSKGRAGLLRRQRVDSWVAAAERVGGNVTVMVEPSELKEYRASLSPWPVAVVGLSANNIGVGAARQEAFQHALSRRVPYMAHIDDDVKLVGDIQQVLALVQRHPESLYSAWEQRILKLWCPKEYEDPSPWIRSWNQLDAQARIYNVDNLASIGGFDPRLRTWEDTEVNIRWGLAGGWPAVIAKHCPQSAGGFHAPGGVSASPGTADQRLRDAAEIINALPRCAGTVAVVPQTKGKGESGQTIKLKWDRKRFWDEICGLKDAREMGL